MDIILVPGLWLDATCWDAVLPRLEKAGHTPRPLTLPGLEGVDVDRSAIGLDDQVDAVVAAIDSAADPVILVGHSMGCGVASIAVDRRPDRIARAIYIGGWPATPDEPLCDGFHTEGADLPMPPLSEFDDADLRGFDAELRESFVARAIPSPARLATDPARLVDDRRHDVAATLVCPEYSADQLRAWVDAGEVPVRTLPDYRGLTYLDIDTGHWPQLTHPDVLADALLADIER